MVYMLTLMVNVTIYGSTMDPMGNIECCFFNELLLRGEYGEIITYNILEKLFSLFEGP